MFDDEEFKVAFQAPQQEPQLVMIRIDDERGLLAVVKAYGNGQACCIAFAPATDLAAPFEGYRPQFLRKTVTNDFSLRIGAWKPVSLESNNAVILRNAAIKVLESVEKTDPAQIETIDMQRPGNTSSAPDVALAVYRADDHTPFEKALVQLMGIETKHSTNSTNPSP